MVSNRSSVRILVETASVRDVSCVSTTRRADYLCDAFYMKNVKHFMFTPICLLHPFCTCAWSTDACILLVDLAIRVRAYLLFFFRLMFSSALFGVRVCYFLLFVMNPLSLLINRFAVASNVLEKNEERKLFRIVEILKACMQVWCGGGVQWANGEGTDVSEERYTYNAWWCAHMVFYILIYVTSQSNISTWIRDFPSFIRQGFMMTVLTARMICICDILFSSP